jgi:hypothetical protein
MTSIEVSIFPVDEDNLLRIEEISNRLSALCLAHRGVVTLMEAAESQDCPPRRIFRGYIAQQEGSFVT